MSRAIRFGILSFAHDHAHFWAHAINRASDARLVGIWDDDAARGQRAARDHAADFVPDLTRLLGKCDAVGITSTTASHAPLIEAAARAGVHVLCEKPLATALSR